MKGKLTNNLSLKILSVIIAVLLWLVVVNIDDPVTTESYTGIRVTMLNENTITGKGKVYKIEDDSDLISVTVNAKRSVHKKLTSADFVATADMEKDIQYDNLVAINVTCTNRNVRTSDIKKSWNNVKVSIEDSATEDFNVVVKQKGTPGSGYMVGEMIPEQRVLSVTGPASMIARIKRIEAEVDVTGRTGDDTVICNLTVLNSDGDLLDTTSLDYNGKTDGMPVKLTMLKTKEVGLHFEVSGTPAAGYRYTGLTFKPETIEIAGSSENLQGLNKISIPKEAVNIDGASDTQQIEVNLVPYLPENIRVVDEATDGLAVVTVEIEANDRKEVTLPVSRISITGVPRGYSVSFENVKDVTIPVMGLTEELDELDTEEIAVILDVSSLSKSGTYTRPLEVYIPGECSLEVPVMLTFELIKGNNGLGNSEDVEDIREKFGAGEDM